MSSHRSHAILLVTILVVSSVLVGCGAAATPTGTNSPTAGATKAPTSVPATATKAASPTVVPPTATASPTVGGNYVSAILSEPRTLDPHLATTSIEAGVASWIGASLVARDPDGNYVPYLAASWQVSDDGLNWDFSLRKDVKFHDGTPLTAQDYAWTFNRIIDPETKAVAAKAVLGPLQSATALDDHTLRLTLETPFFPILFGLTEAGYLQPLRQAVVEKMGEQYGHNPVGVGPYKFKEWRTGTQIVLERNPDYSWAPSFLRQGPYYIQTMTFRVIPDQSTVLAGLEAGEINQGDIDVKDLDRFKALGTFDVFQFTLPGMAPLLLMNNSKAPFDDLNVRKAFNMAVDRESIIKAIALGTASVQLGPLSSTVAGYSPEAEKLGYGYDLAQAKSLMSQAGYTPGSDGTLVKDGKPLKLVLKLGAETTDQTKLAQVLQGQLRALGVDIEIETGEFGAIVGELMAGNYDLTIIDFSYSEADLLYIVFHSSNAGEGYNIGQVKDSVLDDLLTKTRTSTDPGQRQQAVTDAQKYIAQNAFVVPVYSKKIAYVVSNRFKGVVAAPKLGTFFLNDAYIPGK